ncbi:MAG TPA: DUF1559 domain-containing protein [Planctomycetaceae bacterium]|nr:DUF1559 domain-containing protein [Planctomycetaceae bacterium]
MLRTTKQVPAAASRRLCVATVGVLVLAGLAAAGLRGSGGVLGQAAAAQAEDESRSRAAQPQAGRDADAARGADAAQGTLTAEGRVGAFDTSYVPAEALGFIAVRPAAILARPEMKPFIELLGSEGGVQTPLGLPLQEIEQLSFTLIPPLQPERRSQALFLPFGAMTARATRAHDFREFLQKAAPDAVRIPTMGREFFRSREGEGLAYFRPDDRTLVVGSVQDIARMIGAGPGTTWRWPSDDATAAALTGAHYVTLVDTALFKSLLEQAEAEATLQSVRARREAERAGLRGVGLPWYAAMAQMKLLQAAYSPLWEQTKSITFALKLGEELSVEWLFDSENEADGQAVRRTIDALLTLARNMSASAAEMARQEAAGRAEEPLLVAVLKLAQELLDNAKLEQDGAHVRLATSGSLGGEQANAVAALTESVKAARAAARRTQSMNNLKQIALAFHNYHDVYGRFPPAVLYGEDGKTPHSWRVAILPFIEQARLYEQYRFNEPWDSEHNRTILAQIPDVYRHPDEPSDGTNASYFALVGEKTVFTGAKAPRNEAGTRVSQITDGTSNTLLVVEAKRQIPWTKPEDIPFDPGNELPKLGGYTEGGFNAALCDGSVRFLSNAIQETVLRALITRGGGEPIRYEDLEPRR